MTTKTPIQQHGSTPNDLKSPVYRGASATIQSDNAAGGKVHKSQYEGNGPRRE
jgi:hypothetical protein